MNHPVSLLRCTALFLLLCAEVGATSLQNAELFEINAFIDAESRIVPRQHVRLEIETATSGWFSQGTRITLPEVPGLIILQRETFAANASERRGTTTWVIQRWTLDVFPLTAGSFRIPAIPLEVGVTDGESAAQGTVFTPPLSLTVTLPRELTDKNEWVASSSFRVQQQFDRAVDTLTVGDAVEQRITFETQDLPAMMLPVYLAPQLEGLSAYPDPPQLESRNNRGVASAKRVTTVSYVVESPGEFVIPARDFYWWNTTTENLEVVTLPAVTLSAGQGTPGDNEGLLHVALYGLASLTALAVIIALLRLAAREGASNLAGIPRWLDRPIGWWRRVTKPALPNRFNP